MSEENLSFLRERVRDLERKNDDLVKDNGGQRDEIRDLKAQLGASKDKVSELEAAKPKEGQRVLSKAEAERFAAFEALNLGVDDVKERLSQGETYRREAIVSKNREAVRKVGLKPSILNFKQFEDVELIAEGEGDDLKVNVRQGDEVKPWSEWVAVQNLTDDLKDFGLDSQPRGVPAMPQREHGDAVKTDLWKEAGDKSFG